jgi:hypothetical protein
MNRENEMTVTSGNVSVANIPTLIQCQSQGSSLDLYYLKETLERLKNSYGLDLDPDFQRGHVWTMDHKIKFLEFIFRGGKVPAIVFNSPAYAGTSPTRKTDLPETVVLVDGKQRLTTLLGFLNSEIAIFGGSFIHDFDNVRKLLTRASMMYIVNNLQTRKELLRWYLEMNSGTVAHSSDELQRVQKMLDESA